MAWLAGMVNDTLASVPDVLAVSEAVDWVDEYSVHLA
jgi:hypothetical protein